MLRLLPTSEQATMLAAQGFGLQAIMNVITKGRGGRALVSAEVAAIERIAKNTKPSIHTVSGTVYTNKQLLKYKRDNYQADQQEVILVFLEKWHPAPTQMLWHKTLLIV